MKLRILIFAAFISFIALFLACNTDQNSQPKNNSPDKGLISANGESSGSINGGNASTLENEREGRTTRTRRGGDNGGGGNNGGDNGRGGNNGGDDGGGTGGGGDDGGTTGGGSHNAGLNCISCHNGAGEAPLFTVGGTIYTSSAGTTTDPGITVRIYSGPNSTGTLLLTLVSDASGNIHSSSSINLSGGVYPVVVNKTTGTVTAMPISTTSGGCNASGCHNGTSNPRVYVN